ncbi:sulfite exporter TauE/SafE family protein [Collinsella vaginalis]|uniref:sulfite exporter TauE/SafE family protein n=1 Tax=Collinsella vaginalis TaxID=1870987 RepID=UPI000A269A44|nr:sulfite exporter TauE/SafE family protein [Collinsella vaginalis]
MTFLFFIISFGASAVGAICGIGGGIIIKPVLDAAGVLPIAIINFLSGCTVLAMSLYSVGRSRLAGSLPVTRETGVPLAIGAAAGGVAGKLLFSAVQSSLPHPEEAGVVQAAVLLIITAATLVYTLRKDRIETKHLTGAALCLVVGLLLGVMSSFLGIGGGPINLVVLMYLFGMRTKEAAANSLFIILLSQLTNTILMVMTVDLTVVDAVLVVGMITAGLAGGAVGHRINAHIEERHVDMLFRGLLVVIMAICCYNVVHLMGA